MEDIIGGRLEEVTEFPAVLVGESRSPEDVCEYKTTQILSMEYSRRLVQSHDFLPSCLIGPTPVNELLIQLQKQ